MKAKLLALLEILLFTIFMFINYLTLPLLFVMLVPMKKLQEATCYTIYEFMFFIAILGSAWVTGFASRSLRKRLGLKIEPSILKTAFVSPTWGKDLLLGFSIGAIFVIVNMSLLYLGGGYTPMTPVNWNFNLLVPLTFFLFVGFAEELTSRGFIFLTLEKGFGTRVALVVASLQFGFFHMINEINGIGEQYKPLACLFLAIEAGFLLNAAFLIRRSLWLPIGIHWSWNLFESSVYGPKEGQIKFLPTLFTGHYHEGLFLPGFPMGMESSYVTLVTGFVTGLILLRYAKKNTSASAPVPEPQSIEPNKPDQ